MRKGKVVIWMMTVLCVIIPLVCESVFAGYILAGWGDNGNGQCNVPAGGGFVTIASGSAHSVALKSDGSLVAWGANNVGQLEVPVGDDFVDITAHSQHNVALTSYGSLVAWGWNDRGQCNVPDGNDHVAIAAGQDHSLALKSDGQLLVWGSNDYGQCNVPDGNDYVAITAGTQHNVAIKSDGSLAAWGRNDYGQCDVPDGNDYVAIAAGLWHSLALKSDGSLAAWGRNNYGQCNIPTGNDFVAITAGWLHNLVLTSYGSLAAWGDNDHGQCNVPSGSDFVGIAGGYDHSLALISFGDECADAIPVNSNEPYYSSTVNATGTNISSCADKDTFDVWHSFTPKFNYEYTISLCGSAFDTTLAVYDECEGTELVCNDDTEPGVCPSELQSQLTIALEKGSTYFIRIAGFKYQTGDYTLTVIGPRCIEYPVMDFNKNCKVDFADLAIFLQSWLECNWDPPEVCLQ